MKNNNNKYLETVKNPTEFVDFFKDELVIEFVKNFFKNNYQNFFPQNKEESIKLVDNVFDLLVKAASQKDSSLDVFNQAVEEIIFKLFHYGEPDFWFYKRYDYYKSVVKPEYYLKIFEPKLRGNKILDFGAGRGDFAELLALKGYDVSATDVMDNISNNVTDIDFRLMPEETVIPFDSDEFDTVIVNTVLHHVSEKNIKLIFKELCRVGKTILILEDAYHFDDLNKIINEKNKNSYILKDFLLNFNSYQRLAICKIIDYYGNALAQGLYYMNFPFNFHNSSEWQEIASQANLKLVEHTPLGISERSLHTFFQGILVFDH